MFGALFFGGGGGVEEVGLGAFGALGAFPLAGGAGGAEVGVVDGFEAAGGDPSWASVVAPVRGVGDLGFAPPAEFLEGGGEVFF